MSRIFKLTEKAIESEMTWDDAIAEGEIETVEEFDTYEQAVHAYTEGGFNEEMYGVE